MTEIEIQTRFRARVRMHCPAVCVVAVPNAGKRGLGGVAQAKREGLASGFPDVMCFWPGRGVAAIEFKVPKGKVSANQADWIERLTEMDIPVTVARDPDEAIEFLRGEGAPFLDGGAH